MKCLNDPLFRSCCRKYSMKIFEKFGQIHKKRLAMESYMLYYKSFGLDSFSNYNLLVFMNLNSKQKSLFHQYSLLLLYRYS